VRDRSFPSTSKSRAAAGSEDTLQIGGTEARDDISVWNVHSPLRVFLVVTMSSKELIISLDVMFICKSLAVGSTDVKLQIQSQVYVNHRWSVGQSILVETPIWGPRSDFCYFQTVAGLFMYGALSDERTVLSFTIAVGPCQRNHSLVRVPRDPSPYSHVFLVSVTNNNGFRIRWLDLLALLYNYNQSWQLTINDCLRLAPFLAGLRVSSLPREWLGSNLRIGHFFSFRCPLVNSPQLNTQLLNCILNYLTNEFSDWIEFTNELPFITTREPNIDHHLRGFHYSFSWMRFLGNRLLIPKQRFCF
jgi:hypothetical protein